MGDASHVQLSSTEAAPVPARTVHGSALRAVNHVAPHEPDTRGAAASPPVQPLRVASVRRDTPVGDGSAASAPVAAPAADAPARPGSGLALRIPENFLSSTSPEMFERVRQALALVPAIAELARPGDRGPWSFLLDPGIDVAAAWDAALAVDDAISALTPHRGIASIVRKARTTGDLDSLASLLSGPPVPLDVLDQTRGAAWAEQSGTVSVELAAFASAGRTDLSGATPAVLDLPLPDMHALSLQTPGVSWLRRRRRLTTVRAQLAPTLAPGSRLPLRELPALTAALLRVQDDARALRARVAAVPGVALPPTWNPLTQASRHLVDRQLGWLRRMGRAVEGSTGFSGALRWFLDDGPVLDRPAGAAVAQLRDALGALLAATGSTSELLASWCTDDGVVIRWILTRPERLVDDRARTSLRRRVELLTTLAPLKDAGMADIHDAVLSGTLPAAAAAHAFDRGVLAAVNAAVDAGRDDHVRVLGTRWALTAQALTAQALTAQPLPELDAARPLRALPSPARHALEAPARPTAAVPPASTSMTGPQVAGTAPLLTVVPAAVEPQLSSPAAPEAAAAAPVAEAGPPPTHQGAGVATVATPARTEPVADAIPAPRSPAGAAAPASAVRPQVSSGSADALPPTPRTPTPRPAPPQAPRSGTRSVRLPGALAGEKPFVPWTPETIGDRKLLDQLNDPTAARTVRRVLAAGIKAEGPIHQERLARLTAHAFGLSRLSEARRQQIIGLLLPSVTVHGDFIWPKGLEPSSWIGFRRQNASADRPLEHVPPEEIANAMAALCRASDGMTRDALFLGTLQVLGYNRRTPALVAHLDTVLGQALATGRVSGSPAGVLTS